MQSFFFSITLLVFLFISGCSYNNNTELLQRLNDRLPKHNDIQQTKKSIPRYGNSEDIPIYEPTVNYNGQIYPTYDAEADNPSSQGQEATTTTQYQYSYPVYDAEADNPYYYIEETKTGFSDRIYPEVYPTYEQDADNPYYPEDPYYEQQQPQPQEYQYQYYSPEADNPVLPSDSGSGLFDSPSFDAPLFAD